MHYKKKFIQLQYYKTFAFLNSILFLKIPRSFKSFQSTECKLLPPPQTHLPRPLCSLGVFFFFFSFCGYCLCIKLA